MQMKINKKRQRRKEGQVVYIDLGEGKHSYARVLENPLFAFYDREFNEDEIPNIEEIIKLPIAFKIDIMNYVFKENRWPVQGWVELEPALKEQPKFWKQDPFTGDISIYHVIPELAPLYERPATYGEAKDLECAAVWDPEHAEDRLRDHFAGRPNKWVESMKIKKAR